MMSDFQIHTIDSAPEAAKPLLEGAKKNLGFVPNLYGVLAESPAVLESYQFMSGLVGNTNLDATERQVVFQSNNFEAECRYCMAAHTTLSQMDKVPEEITEALRAGTELPDAKLNALSVFTKKVRGGFGAVSDEDLQAFYDAGYKQAHVLDVIMLSAMKVISNYTNKFAETPVDDAFKPNAWEKPQAIAAE